MSPTTRPLPDNVRERMRARVMAGLEPAPPWRRVPLILTAAATAAVLAGVVAFIAPPEPTGPATPTSPPVGPPMEPTLDPVLAAADLDRCWAQVQASGNALGYPDRARWKAVLTVAEGGRQVTAARADGMPLFCSTTATSVSLSAPRPIASPPNGPTALLVTTDGVIAGIAPGKSLVMVSAPDRRLGTGGVMGDGLFAVVLGAQDPLAMGPIEVSLDSQEDYRPWDLREAPRPALAVVDKPEVAPDRATELGALVAQCVERAGDGGPVFDAPSWRAGMLSPLYGDKRYLVIRNSRYVTACEVAADGTVRFPLGPRYIADIRPVKQFIGVPTDPMAGSAFAVGWVAPEVARMEIETHDGTTITATISNGSFAVGELGINGGDLALGRLRLYDQAGTLIHTGVLQEPA